MSKAKKTRIEQELEKKEQDSGLFAENLNDPYLDSTSEIKDKTSKSGLGSIKKETNTEKTGMTLGWHTMNISMLPSAGRFYPEDATLEIKAASVADIRHFSTLDETDLFDVDDKLNHVIKNCSRLVANSRQMTWKDILEEDRIFVLLAIRDLTFSEPEN